MTIHKSELGMSHSYSKYRELGLASWTRAGSRGSHCSRKGGTKADALVSLSLSLALHLSLVSLVGEFPRHV